MNKEVSLWHRLLDEDEAAHMHELYGTLPAPPLSRVQLLHRNVKRFRGGLVFKAHRLLYHSTLGLRVIKKKKKKYEGFVGAGFRVVT